MGHQETVLVLQSIHRAMLDVQMKQHLKLDRYLVLQPMLVQIVRQHRHLNMDEWHEFVQYKHEQHHMKLPRKSIL